MAYAFTHTRRREGSGHGQRRYTAARGRDGASGMYHQVLCAFVHLPLLLVLDPFLPGFLPGTFHRADLTSEAGVVQERGLPLRPRLLPRHCPQSTPPCKFTVSSVLPRTGGEPHPRQVMSPIIEVHHLKEETDIDRDFKKN